MSSHQPSPGPSYVPQSMSRGRAHKQMAPGIAAGVEDEKYQAKYRELRKKVKEVESANDRLMYKVVAAKRNILRMRLERAVLYERIAALPPSPPRQHAPLPGAPPPPAAHGHHHHGGAYELVDPHEAREREARAELAEYLRAHPNANVRVVPGPDGRPIPVEDPLPPPVQAPPPPMHTSSRRGSAGDVHRQAPAPAASHYEARHASYADSHAAHAHSYDGRSSHGHSHGNSHHRESRGHSHTHAPREPSPPVPAAYAHGSGGHTHMSAPPSPTSSRSTSHGVGRYHQHQRVGPGANMNLGEWERQHEERVIEREVERERELQAVQRHPRPASPVPNAYAARRAAEEPHYAPSPALPHRRSDTPGSVREGETPRRLSPRDLSDREAAEPPRKRVRSEAGSRPASAGVPTPKLPTPAEVPPPIPERETSESGTPQDSEVRARSSGEPAPAGEPMDAD